MGTKNMGLVGLAHRAGTSSKTGKPYDFIILSLVKPYSNDERGGNLVEYGGGEAFTVNLDTALVQKALNGREMSDVIGAPVTLLFDQDRRPVLFQIGDTDDTATVSEDTFNI